MPAQHPILLISGVPATGKTTFGDWLQQTKSFLHIDVERNQMIPALELLNSQSQSQPVAVTWGFRPIDPAFEILQGWKNHGVNLWWFTAETALARKYFKLRGGSEVTTFDYQMGFIEREWARIESLFAPNILETLTQDGYLDPENIYLRIVNDLR